MALERYHEKRDFKATPEPRGRTHARKTKALSFVIQKHAASHLHYDFRLELEGVLLSWAVPKGPSLDPADKRLAMHVEDHPIEYGGFEGIIPKGQYGGGTVLVWDRGAWSPVGDPREGYAKGHLKFDLDGEKLHGRWALVKTHGSRYGGRGDAWLLIKDTDEYARRGVDAHIVDSEPDSVASQRSIDEIANDSEHEWHSNRSVKQNLRAGALTPRLKKTKAVEPKGIGRKAAMPAQLSPMLATLVKSPPTGDDWAHEVKYDGYRMLCRLEKGQWQIHSRNGKDWTQQLPAIVKMLKKVKAESAWIDGEVCAVDDAGRSDFQALQNAISGEGKAKPANLVYFAFDLLYLNSRDLRAVPLSMRKALLQALLESSKTEIRYSPEVRGSGAEVFKQSCPAGLEGIVSKRIDSTYLDGKRTQSWVKVKCLRRQEMVIGGYTEPQGSRNEFGALLLGYYEDGELRYSGKVGTGFNEDSLKTVFAQLKKRQQQKASFANPPRGSAAKGAHWVKPDLVAEIQFTEWSEAGALRHPVFIGLREDKKAIEVTREQAVPLKESKAIEKESHREPNEGKPAAVDSVAGVKLTHPDKLLFPEAGLSKLDLAKYYEAIADWMLPYVKDRPLSLVRCPDGWSGECFYQKHAAAAVHASVQRVQVPESDGTATYMSVNSLAGLIGLVQWGVIELHPWGSRMPTPDKPDQLIFDFDPDDKVPWPQLVDAVNGLRTLLDQLGLKGFLKTTGGKGLHVIVPIRRTVAWTQAKAFSKAIADLFARTFPQFFIATLSKAKRDEKIFIDYLRNAEGATAIAPYGIRSRKNAPVATPIAWDELAQDVRFDYFNVRTVPQRLREMKQDPWEDFQATQQTLTAAMFKQLGAQR